MRNVRFSEDSIHVELEDGRVISAPLAFYPRLLTASPEQLDNGEPSIDRALRMARRLQVQGRFQEALAVCQWVLEREPENPIAWNNKGHVFWKTGSIRTGLRCHFRALTLWPEYPEAWANRGMVLHRLHRYREALTSLDRAIELRRATDDKEHYGTRPQKGRSANEDAFLIATEGTPLVALRLRR